MKNITLVLLLFVASISAIPAQEKIPLYPLGASESNAITLPEEMLRNDFVVNITEARMYAYPAPKEKANGAAVLVCPGGGYSGISAIKEGQEIAQWFNERGITAFVLYYRMPNGNHAIPLKDAQTALSIIHKRAKDWNIRKNKIGIIGFSAGGHLASSVGTLYTRADNRPDFMILVYPVVTMDKALTHGGSRDNLLGKNPSTELEKRFSGELQVNKKTAPTFIVHAKNDNAVPVENSTELYRRLQEYNVSSELHLFEEGGHGFGMRKRNIPADEWPALLEKWLIKQKLAR